MTDYLPPVVAKLTGDDAGLTRVLASSKQDVKRWAVEVGKTKATITVDADTARLDAKLQQIKTGSVDLKVKLDLTAGEAARIRRQVASPAARMPVTLDLQAGAKQALAAKLQQNAVAVKIKPIMDTTAQRRVETILRELGKDIRVRIRPTVDTADQQRGEQRLARLSRDRTAIIRTRVIGGGSPGGGGGGGVDGAGAGLQALISLGPALVPIAATLTNVTVSATAATAGVAAFALAAKSQISAISGAADAQAKYNQAVAKYGANSKQAQAAQEASARSLDGMPPATQRAAEGWLHLKDSFKSWSDSLAGFTMDPVTRGMAVVEAILPRLNPLVKGTSAELDRMVTLIGGAVASPGFDSFMKRLADFSTGVLHRATDDVVHFSRVLSEGGSKGPIERFLAYARAEGPQVRQTLEDLAKAVANIFKASAEAGPGMLKLVDDVAKLVAALPPSFVARAMEVYTAFRLYKLASGPVTTLAGSVQRLAAQMVVMRAASQAAGGGLAGVNAAVGSLSTGAKMAGAIAAIAGLALVAKHFNDEGKGAKVSADDMQASLRSLAAGDSGGAASKTIQQLTKDAGNLNLSLMERLESNDSAWDLITNSGKKTSAAKKDFTELGTTLADMVKAGNSDQAAKALERLNAAGVHVPTKYLKDYNSALADQAFQSKLAAQSMGIFGAQAQQVQKRLDAQKQAAQGLQQAILDLNDANRAATDAESAYQQAIDDATAVIKGHRKALSYTNGELNLNSQKARDAYNALSQLAAAIEANSTATFQQTGSLDKANRKLIEGHDQLVKLAEKFGLGTQDAHKFADALDNIKDPKIQVTVKTDQANANIAAAKKALAGLPSQKTATVRADASQLYNVIRDAQAEINALHGKSVVIRTTYVKGTGNVAHEGGGYAYGGVVPAPLRFAGGGVAPGYAPMQDTISALVSPGEGVLVPEATRALGGPSGINAINRQARSGGSLSSASLSGGVAPIGRDVAAGLWQGLQSQQGWLAAQSRAFALSTIPQPMADALGIASPSKVAMSLGRWVGAGMVQGLTGSTASVKSATLRLTRSIEQVFHDDAQRQLASDRKALENLAGVKGKKAARERADLLADMKQQQRYLSEDSAISRFVAVDNARLLKLAAQRDSVASKLKAAQTNLSNLQKAWTSERDQVASQILQGASVVTTAPQPGFALTAGDVVNNLRDQAGKASTFAAELRQLQKAGLRSDLIAQIAAAGVDQGGATAAALAGASKDTIKQLNSIQAGLASSANSTGAAVADSMYKNGINAAKGLIKGLESQESAIEKQMLKIAKSMQKAIREALGIHSPSTVMAVDGENTGRGFALGLDRSVKHVAIAASGLAMAARQGASLTSGGGYRGGGGGEVHYHYNTVNLTVQGSVVAARQLVDEVEDALAVRARNNPGGFRPAATWSGR